MSHYLRSALQVNLCTDYATVPVGGCSSRFEGGSTAGAGASSGQSLEPRLATSFSGDRPDEAGLPPLLPVETLVGGEELRERGLDQLRDQSEAGSPALDEAGTPLLDYLLEDTP